MLLDHLVLPVFLCSSDMSVLSDHLLRFIRSPVGFRSRFEQFCSHPPPIVLVVALCCWFVLLAPSLCSRASLFITLYSIRRMIISLSFSHLHQAHFPIAVCRFLSSAEDRVVCVHLWASGSVCVNGTIFVLRCQQHTAATALLALHR